MKFDGLKKLILLDETDIVLNVKQLYYMWRNWANSIENLKYPLAMRSVGGDKLDETRLGITYFLTNGWKIKPASMDYTLKVEGNLYSDDKSNIFVPADGNHNVMIVNKVSNLIDIVPVNVYNNVSNLPNTAQPHQEPVEYVATDGDDDGDWVLSN